MLKKYNPFQPFVLIFALTSSVSVLGSGLLADVKEVPRIRDSVLGGKSGVKDESEGSVARTTLAPRPKETISKKAAGEDLSPQCQCTWSYSNTIGHTDGFCQYLLSENKIYGFQCVMDDPTWNTDPQTQQNMCQNTCDAQAKKMERGSNCAYGSSLNIVPSVSGLQSCTGCLNGSSCSLNDPQPNK
jgi:hypothetical protein